MTLFCIKFSSQTYLECLWCPWHQKVLLLGLLAVNAAVDHDTLLNRISTSYAVVEQSLEWLHSFRGGWTIRVAIGLDIQRFVWLWPWLQVHPKFKPSLWKCRPVCLQIRSDLTWKIQNLYGWAQIYRDATNLQQFQVGDWSELSRDLGFLLDDHCPIRTHSTWKSMSIPLFVLNPPAKISWKLIIQCQCDSHSLHLSEVPAPS